MWSFPSRMLSRTCRFPDGDIINIQGRTGKYLETPSGPVTNNILDMVREGLRIELSAALRLARSSAAKATKKRLSVKTNGEYQLINLHVCSLKKPDELAGRLFVVFEDIESESMDETGDHAGKDDSSLASTRIAELERELQTTRESHQTTIEKLESSNEELKSTNEEIQNIFVDNNMQVRRFTPEATMIVNLIPTDIGRPIRHVASNLKYDNMIRDLEKVLQYLTPVETEVQTDEGRWFNMRIIPYRTRDTF
ncbi:PAS domain-containing protein [Desulfobacter sp.]|uniref:PAS domain-containing protein n=1 Tax=Desulfobacter sp. TaxID=2294 RepID=UPI003D11C0CF